MSNNKQILLNGSTINLSDKDYLASGGEGSVYRQNATAFKIYHDPTKCIAEAKINELKVLDMPSILGPRDVIYDPKSKKPIGYTMPFVKDTEYLSRLFVNSFKKANNITPEMVVDIVKKMQETLIEIHKKNILVGDYNEMNFLVDKTFTIPYYIDVDSYQTKNFHCTAIMDSVRDRTLPFGTFKETSDWFSWAIVTFQLYTGIHPFKGKHPTIPTGDLDARMLNNISVFDKDVKIPKALQDFSVIPKAHLDWYKHIFSTNDRSIPPFADAIGLFTGYVPVAVISGGGLVIELVYDYNTNIIDVYMINNKRYVVTEKSIYLYEKEIFSFKSKATDILLANCLGVSPIIAVKKEEYVGFFDLDRNEIGRISADSFMTCNGSIYTMRNGILTENYFEQLGKIKHLTRQASPVAENSSKMFEGVIFQDIFGKMKLTIPYEHRKCTTIDVPELNGYRIIDAKRIGRFCIAIGEKGGKFDRIVIYFNESFTTYEHRGESDVDYRSVNLMVKDNGMAVTVKEQNTLELFYDIKRGVKEISDSPVELTMDLCNGSTNVLFINDSKLYSIKS